MVGCHFFYYDSFYSVDQLEYTDRASRGNTTQQQSKKREYQTVVNLFHGDIQSTETSLKYFPCTISLSLNNRMLRPNCSYSLLRWHIDWTRTHTHKHTQTFDLKCAQKQFSPFWVLLNTTTAEALSDNGINAGWTVLVRARIMRSSTDRVWELLFVCPIETG